MNLRKLSDNVLTAVYLGWSLILYLEISKSYIIILSTEVFVQSSIIFPLLASRYNCVIHLAVFT